MVTGSCAGFRESATDTKNPPDMVVHSVAERSCRRHADADAIFCNTLDVRASSPIRE